MKKIPLIGIACVVCLFARSSTVAQEISLSDLRTQYEQEKAELLGLRRIINALDGIDTAFTSYFPVWSVLDQTLKLKVYALFRSRNLPFDEADEVLVVASPDTQELFDIRIGESRYGRLFSRAVLDRDLKQELLQLHAYPFSDVVPPGYRRNTETRKGVPQHVPPDWVALNISLFSGALRFGNDWSIVGKLGDDLLGYPFWSSGQAWLMVKYKSLAVGSRLPMHGGLDDFSIGLSTRRMNGSTGLAAEFEIEWDKIRIPLKNFTYSGIGGSFSMGNFNNRREELYTPDINNLFSITTVLDLHYAFDYQFDYARQMLNVHIGYIHHSVAHRRLDVIGLVKAGASQQFDQPYIAIEYKHQQSDWFRLGMRWSRLVMFSAWAEIVPSFVFVEVKYSTLAFRDPKPWENYSYFYGTFGLNFSF